MDNKRNTDTVERFIAECARRDFTLEQVGAAVGHTKGWASLLVKGRIKRPGWKTMNSIRRFLGES